MHLLTATFVRDTISRINHLKIEWLINKQFSRCTIYLQWELLHQYNIYSPMIKLVSFSNVNVYCCVILGWINKINSGHACNEMQASHITHIDKQKIDVVQNTWTKVTSVMPTLCLLWHIILYCSDRIDQMNISECRSTKRSYTKKN